MKGLRMSLASLLAKGSEGGFFSQRPEKGLEFESVATSPGLSRVPGGPDNLLVRVAKRREASGETWTAGKPRRIRRLLRLRRPDKQVVRATQVNQPDVLGTLPEFCNIYPPGSVIQPKSSPWMG
jgi:hypothetical protein